MRSTGAWSKADRVGCVRWQGVAEMGGRVDLPGTERDVIRIRVAWEEESCSRRPAAGRSYHNSLPKSEASRTEQRTWDCPHSTWITRASSEQEEIPGLLYWNNLHPLPLRIFTSEEVRGLHMKCLSITQAREILFKRKGNLGLWNSVCCFPILLAYVL